MATALYWRSDAAALASPLFSPPEFIGLFVLNGVSILCSLFVVVFIHMYRNDISVLAATRPERHWRERQQQLGRSQRQRSILRPIGTQATMYLSLPAPLRLLFIASIVDVLYSVFRIYYLSVSMPGFGGSHQANCKASMTGVTFFNLMSVFVRALLSVHLQLVILSNVGRAMSYERHFLIGALLVSLVLSLLPVFTKNYVWLSLDPTMSSAHCGYFPLQQTTNDDPESPGAPVWTEAMAKAAMRKGLAIMWSTNFAWLTLTVVYGAVVIVSVVIRMAQQRRAIKGISRTQNMIVESAQRRREFLHMTTRVVRRILQFPLMVFVCHVLEVVYGMATLSRAIQLIRSGSLDADKPGDFTSNKDLTRLYLASHVMLGMEGIITLFFLPLEPPIRLMLRTMYLRKRSEIRRLGTLPRAMSRRKPSRHVPRPRAADPHATSEDTFTLSSFMQQSNSLQVVTDDKEAGTSSTGPQSPCPPTVREPDSAHRQEDPNAAPSLPELPALSIVMDHVVTQADRGGGRVSEVMLPSASSPRRRATRMLRYKSQRRPGTRPPSLPQPVLRAQTINDLPWDIVAVPRRRSRTGSVVMQPAIVGNAISPVLALRNDGLPALQWYVPQAELGPGQNDNADVDANVTGQQDNPAAAQ
ncbi:hypothetical protein GGF46_000035 [Coemansia sp. RSA 552]|nr:hypothetical protein GGF46_000035 [Coemansia sp. RSA 552]